MSESRRPLPDVASARRSLRSVRDVLRFGVTMLEAHGAVYGQGTVRAYDEVAALLLWALHLPPDELDPWLDARLNPAEVAAALQLLEKRALDRVPAAYLTGEAWLRGLRFRADERALVPRSPIAEILEESLPAMLPQLLPHAPPDWPRSVLDLCTGGGSLAIVAAHLFPQAQVAASDRCPRALELCRENLELHGLDEHVELFQGDALAPLGGRRFDLLICNPPYVPLASMRALPPEYRAEPQVALAGGDDDGMGFIAGLLPQVAASLQADGLLVLEVGHEADAFDTRFPALEVAWLPAAAGERMVLACTRAALLAAFGPPARIPSGR